MCIPDFFYNGCLSENTDFSNTTVLLKSSISQGTLVEQVCSCFHSEDA